MAPKVTLHYFNAKGRAEPIRWILEYVGIKYEDTRFGREQWPEVKKRVVTGMVPQLDFDGFELAETNAIIHFLGKEYKLAGKDAKEEALCLMIANVIGDYVTKMGRLRYEEDEARKATMKQELVEKTAPQFFGFIMKTLKKSGQPNKHYLVGDSLTYVDLLLGCLLDTIFTMAPEDSKKFPAEINAFKDNIMAIPAISAWVKKRPDTAI